MGNITSAATIYATAYLTEKGRQYLFNQGNIRFDSSGNDLLKIESFTLSDTDTNYATAARLESGDVPDITGKSEDCIKATADYYQNIFMYYTVDVLALVDPEYSTDAPGNILLLDVDSTTTFPTSSTTDTPPTSGGSGGPIGPTTFISGPTIVL
jgi:hypothetical protein